MSLMMQITNAVEKQERLTGRHDAVCIINPLDYEMLKSEAISYKNPNGKHLNMWTPYGNIRLVPNSLVLPNLFYLSYSDAAETPEPVVDFFLGDVT